MNRKLILWLVLAAGLLCGCQVRLSTDPGLRLSFSADTVRFDTAFAGLSTPTKTLCVYNPHRSRLLVSQVYLERGVNSPFRFNLDGFVGGGGSLRDVEIIGRDSLFLYLEATPPESPADTAEIHTDRLHFLTNGNDQVIELVATGLNAVSLRELRISHDTTLQGGRPHLVYGYIVVDSAATLTLAAGTQLYFHSGAQMAVYGGLVADGTVEQPVSLQSDRLDQIFEGVNYQMVSGQWTGVFLASPSRPCSLRHTEITNSQYGLYVQGNSINHLPSVSLDGCLIHNHSAYGLTLINADATVVNTQVSNCGTYCVYLAGGTHRFVHTTVANYYGNTNVNIQNNSRSATPAVCINDIPKGAPMSVSFENSIVAGTRAAEWQLLSYFSDRFAGTFVHCFLQTADSATCKAREQYADITYGTTSDSLFLVDNYRLDRLADYDFRLREGSPAIGRADSLTASHYPTDRLGNSRLADHRPDLGCYEFQ